MATSNEKQNIPIESQVPGTSKATNSSPKRKADSDCVNNEMPLSKRLRPNFAENSDQFMRVMKFLIYGNAQIAQMATLLSEFRESIAVAIQAHDIFMSCHHINLDAVCNLEPPTLKDTPYTIKYLGQGYQIDRKQMVAEMVKAAGLFNLEYKNFAYDDPDNWYGIAGSIINYSAGFRLRLSELKNGREKMPKKNYYGGSNFDLFDGTGGFGYCQGISWLPQIRTCMRENVGPITALIQLLVSPKEEVEKWKATVLNHMPHIPQIEAIADQLIGRDFHSAKPMVRAVIDVLMLTGSCMKNRMFFPTNFLIFGLWSKLINNRDELDFSQETSPVLPIFDFTGPGGFLVYKAIQREKFTFPGSHTPEGAAQVLFHCIFNTDSEDLGILSGLTNVDRWLTRSELGNGFKKRNETYEVGFVVPEMRYWSPLSSAVMTNFITPSYREKVETQIKSWNEMEKETKFVRLLDTLKELFKEIASKIEEDNYEIKTGTSAWYDMANLTTTGIGEPTEPVLINNNLFFWNEAAVIS